MLLGLMLSTWRQGTFLPFGAPTTTPGATAIGACSDAWTGTWGSRGRDFTSDQEPDGTVVYEIGALRPREGVTIEVSLPGDAVARPGVVQRAGLWLADNFVYALWPAKQPVGELDP